jgi:hypothetical protein
MRKTIILRAALLLARRRADEPGQGLPSRPVRPRTARNRNSRSRCLLHSSAASPGAACSSSSHAWAARCAITLSDDFLSTGINDSV